MQTKMRWTEVIDAAADAHVGQTLVRLAKLAASAHLHATAADLRKDDVRIHGRVPSTAGYDGELRDAGSHTEVGR